MKKLSLYLILASSPSSALPSWIYALLVRSPHTAMFNAFVGRRAAPAAVKRKELRPQYCALVSAKKNLFYSSPKKLRLLLSTQLVAARRVKKIEEIPQLKDDIWTISALCYYCPFIIIGLFGPAYFWNSKVRHVKTSIKNLSNKIGQKKAR